MFFAVDFQKFGSARKDRQILLHLKEHGKMRTTLVNHRMWHQLLTLYYWIETMNEIIDQTA